MFKEVRIPFELTDFVLLGELLFFAIFAVSLFWVFRKGSKEFYDKLSRLPHDDNGELQ